MRLAMAGVKHIGPGKTIAAEDLVTTGTMESYEMSNMPARDVTMHEDVRALSGDATWILMNTGLGKEDNVRTINTRRKAVISSTIKDHV